MNSIEEVINFIKNNQREFYYMLFPRKIVYGKKYGCLFFLQGNLFDSIPIFIGKESFEGSILKKYLVVNNQDNVIVTVPLTNTTNTGNTSSTTTSNTTSNTTTCNCEDYEIILKELIKGVLNIKEVYQIDRNNLKNIVDNYNTQVLLLQTINN